MQGHYPFVIDREMGCTAAELRACLPQACAGRAIAWHEHSAAVALDAGQVTVAWVALEPRRIARLALPRLQVHFAAEGVDAEAWQRFMRHFDLVTQRGGG